MPRFVIASLALCFLSATTPLRAQVAMLTDSIARSSAPADSAARPIRVTSRSLPFELRDLAGTNCTYFSGGEDAIKRILNPWSCTRRMTGTMSRMDADSIVFIRHGRPIALAMRDVRRIERPNGRSAWRTMVGGVVGGLVGLVGAGIIGIGDGYGDNDGAFIATAAAFTTGGAAIGAYRGGKAWAEVPRPVERAPVAPR